MAIVDRPPAFPTASRAAASGRFGGPGRIQPPAAEPDAPLMPGQHVPSASERRLALKQKPMFMAELALAPEPAPADKPKPARPSPHTERRNETFNT